MEGKKSEKRERGHGGRENHEGVGEERLEGEKHEGIGGGERKVFKKSKRKV